MEWGKLNLGTGDTRSKTATISERAKEYADVELHGYLDGVNKGLLPFQDPDTGNMFDLLAFWERMKHTMPILYLMHLDYSPIQGNSSD
jgi:hypothetical protein